MKVKIWIVKNRKCRTLVKGYDGYFYEWGADPSWRTPKKTSTGKMRHEG